MVPATKRRKLEHTSSDEEDDASSLASFGASDTVEATAGLDDVDGASSGEELDIDNDMASDESQSDLEGEEIEEKEDDVEQVATKAPNGTKVQSQATKAKAARPSAEVLATRKRAAAGPTQTSGSFKNNVFKLQVDELLEQIRPRHSKREVAAEAALHKLKNLIDKLPSLEPMLTEDAERSMRKKKVAIPFPVPRPPKDAKYKLEFQRPAKVDVIGSHVLKTASRARDVLETDMVVTLPSEMLQEKDYLNHRYLYKRAYYLGCLAAGLRESKDLEFVLEFASFRGNPLQPILVVRDVVSDSKKPWQINILPCVAEHVFPANKLRPDKSCIRSPTTESNVPTPFYNSSLRAEMLVRSYNQLLHSTETSTPAFKDACLLGSTWLRQRGIGCDVASGGFGNFEWSALMVLMLDGGGPNDRSILSSGYSSYQLLKATLQVLAMKDLGRQPLVIHGGEDVPKAPGDGSPMVWDGLRGHNLLYKMTPWSYRQLRREAQTTLTMLGDQKYDGFDATFILRSDGASYRYDCTLDIDCTKIQQSKSTKDQDLCPLQKQLYRVLRTALGDRAVQIDIVPPRHKPWDVISARPRQKNVGSVRIGIIVNPDTAGRTVDHGPSAEEKTESASFREFWGEKAELRRFKDGSITETLVWSASEDGQPVIEQIVRYALQKHIGQTLEQSMTFTGHIFSNILPQSSTTTGFQALSEAYKQLETDIRSLDGLPLSIRQIMPADAQLRSTSPTIPMTAGSRPIPANVVIQFEASGRWPDDLIAIQRTKIAFFLKLADLLQDSVRSATARIGLENQEHATLNQAYLDVIYDSGAAFRLRIHHDREQTLLERQVKDKSLDPRSREIAARGLANYKRHYLKSPAHTQAIARLCSRHATLSGTIRLVKLWFASHLLANHIPSEVIELLVARTFVTPWPWNTPSSIQTAFLRTLFFLSRWNWRVELLIVDLSGSGDMKPADTQAIATSFEAWRKIDPAMNRVVLFAASNVDAEGTTWTDGLPGKVGAGRMTALAKAAVAEVGGKGLALEPGSLFMSPLGDFDFVLHLDPKFVGKKKKRGKQIKASGTGFKNLDMESLDETELVGYDPVAEFLRELESLFGAAAVFFSGGMERPVIAGLWNPQTKTRAWKLNLAYSTVPKSVAGVEEVQADVNKEGMLAEMARVGGNIVERIEVMAK